MASLTGQPGEYWQVKNGYTSASATQLRNLADEIEGRNRDELLDSVKSDFIIG